MLDTKSSDRFRSTAASDYFRGFSPKKTNIVQFSPVHKVCQFAAVANPRRNATPTREANHSNRQKLAHTSTAMKTISDFLLKQSAIREEYKTWADRHRTQVKQIFHNIKQAIVNAICSKEQAILNTIDEQYKDILVQLQKAKNETKQFYGAKMQDSRERTFSKSLTKTKEMFNLKAKENDIPNFRLIEGVKELNDKARQVQMNSNFYLERHEDYINIAREVNPILDYKREMAEKGDIIKQCTDMYINYLRGTVLGEKRCQNPPERSPSRKKIEKMQRTYTDGFNYS